ncbi:type II toxin-antitoxin system death-on-curing family toxin [Actinacidiphila sp. ITFR-21]|uniref:type II toxin-antitoxin system death-on-curing family toxin n=1 Tax=Actinacidiphila sp. ITFR-21 TaxID=3075199 RepID=UPI00288A1F8A|nr:type II toxin-antitoxin system death-on-curing family toxin [Streptomyces sp. ITFR-21]WNI16843.1 type II toxin-antitoxin system death-on-curing family toxin [Streptomyces sp. ITFR-21]
MDVSDVIQIAEITLGVRVGVRDWGLLQSAVARPQASVFGEDAYPTLFEKAAALLHSLSSSYSLVDGNKRTSWASAVVFLDINGYARKEPLDEDAAEKLVLAVARSQLTNPVVADRIQTFVAAATSGEYRAAWAR